MSKNKKKVVVIGGGTGTYTILTGLKKYKNLDISVIVSMMDDGGSNRIIRDEFGLLPTSDLRQCIVALSSEDSDETLRKLFTYRYNAGTGITGMTFGNLFMAALADIYQGNQKKAIARTCKIFKVSGKIIPCTYEKTNLMATYSNGKQVLGEHDIDEPNFNANNVRIVNLGVVPNVKANKNAIREINSADLIVLGPGDFYTSILPNVVIDGIAEEIYKSKAKVAYILNLMTKYGQTSGFKALDFVFELDKYIGKDRLDYLLVNSNLNFPKNALDKYKSERAQLVENNITGKVGFKVIKKDLVSVKIHKKVKSDKLFRSLIRHDSDKLAKAVMELI